jgi:hypothetical protein
MFRVAGWLLFPALLLLVLLRIQGRQSSVPGQPATATNTGKTTNVTISEYNRRHDNVSEGITYSRTILEFPDNGEDVVFQVHIHYLPHASLVFGS